MVPLSSDLLGHGEYVDLEMPTEALPDDGNNYAGAASNALGATASPGQAGSSASQPAPQPRSITRPPGATLAMKSSIKGSGDAAWVLAA